RVGVYPLGIRDCEAHVIEVASLVRIGGGDDRKSREERKSLIRGQRFGGAFRQQWFGCSHDLCRGYKGACGHKRHGQDELGRSAHDRRDEPGNPPACCYTGRPPSLCQELGAFPDDTPSGPVGGEGRWLVGLSSLSFPEEAAAGF